MVPKQPSLLEGYFAFGLEYHASHQKNHPALIANLPLTDGMILIYALEDQISARLLRIENSKESQVDTWTSPHLNINDLTHLLIELKWKDGNFNLFSLNYMDFLRGSESDRLEIKVGMKKSATAKKMALDDTVGMSIDRSGLNIDLLRNLRQTIERLGWSLNELDPDRPGIALDIAANLRMLLTGKEPLLFSVSKDVGLCLSCYVSASSAKNDSFGKILGIGAVAIEQVASSVPTRNQNEVIEFEKWLKLPALLRNEMQISHWELIRLVADKFSVHADRSGQEELSAFLNTHHPGIDLGILVQFIRQYGILTYEVAVSFLNHLDNTST
jgi:hypothetical protein